MITSDLSYIDSEQLHMFNCYCTYVMLINGKHMNYVNVFIATLKNKFLMKCLRTMLCVSSDYEAIQYFLQQAPTVIKSKHVVKVIHQLEKLKVLNYKHVD